MTKNTIGSRNWRADYSTATEDMPNQSALNSCTSACGVVLLRDYGIEVTEAQVMQFIETDGTELVSFGHVAIGLNKAVQQSEQKPAIVFAETVASIQEIMAHLKHRKNHIAANLSKHAVIVEVIDLEEKTVTLLDPWGKGYGQGIAYRSTISLSRFEQLHREGLFRVLLAFDKK